MVEYVMKASAAIAIIFFAACNVPENLVGRNVAINTLEADSSAGEPTRKLTLTLSDDVPGLSAEDIRINAVFPVIKGVLSEIDTRTFELEITPGASGLIRVGLDPYRGFIGWDAKTAYVYAEFKFVFSGDSGLAITGWEKTADAVEIPAEIAGIPVVAISAGAFSNKNLTEITIPGSVTSIGDNAFASNLLECVHIPGSVTFLSGFNNNELTGVIIPDSVKNIGNSAFLNNKLESVAIPDGVETIGNNAFSRNKLIGIIIPDSVVAIGSSAFSGNSLIGGDITISGSVKTISSGAFSGNQLTDVTIPDGVETIGSNAFSRNQLANVFIPGSVRTIDSGAFSDNCLDKIVIPGSVTLIRNYAFAYNRLTEIAIGADLLLENFSFGSAFETVYNNGRAAGTYTRSDSESTQWKREE